MVLRNTVYLDRALAELHAQDYSVMDTDVAGLSPFLRIHTGIGGHYSFFLTHIPSTTRL